MHRGGGGAKYRATEDVNAYDAIALITDCHVNE